MRAIVAQRFVPNALGVNAGAPTISELATSSAL
jgi:hypothetical protein